MSERFRVEHPWEDMSLTVEPSENEFLISVEMADAYGDTVNNLVMDIDSETARRLAETLFELADRAAMLKVLS